MNGKKKIATKLLLFLLVSCLLLSLITSCKNQSSKKDTNEEGDVTYAGNGAIYPLKSDTVLDVWMALSEASATATSLGDTPFGQEWQKETGVKVNFIHPSSDEQFNLLIASNELPDIMLYDWRGVPGGPEKYIKDNCIIKLNDSIEQYAPNLKKYLQENPDVNRDIKTDSGAYYVFPFIRGDESLTVCTGPLVRKDWLDEIRLNIPETIDDWYNMLKLFKAKGAEIPLSFNFLPYVELGAFSGAYGTKLDFYLEDGLIKYGPAEDGTKDFLMTMNKWYNEGLLDRNIANIDSKVLDSNILNGKVGATMGYAGGSIGVYKKAMKDKDPKFNMVAAPYPTLKKGEKPKFGQKDSKYVTANGAAITGNCKNVELAARFLDFGYSEKGSMLCNFGIEGESYNLVDGYPKYTDLILKNPEGLSVNNALGRYTISASSGPFIQDKRYIEQYYEYPEQKEALNIWGNTDALKYMLPMISFSPEESLQVAKLTNEIKTYVEEMYLKFIMGIEPIENFDLYISHIKELELGEIIQIYQGAVERYNNR